MEFHSAVLPVNNTGPRVRTSFPDETAGAFGLSTGLEYEEARTPPEVTVDRASCP